MVLILYLGFGLITYAFPISPRKILDYQVFSIDIWKNYCKVGDWAMSIEIRNTSQSGHQSLIGCSYSGSYWSSSVCTSDPVPYLSCSAGRYWTITLQSSVLKVSGEDSWVAGTESSREPKASLDWWSHADSQWLERPCLWKFCSGISQHRESELSPSSWAWKQELHLITPHPQHYSFFCLFFPKVTHL